MVWVDHSWEVSISASKHHPSENIGNRTGILPCTPMIRELLRKELKELFPPIDKYDYPVDVVDMFDLYCLPYIHKIIKITDLLRTGQEASP